MTLSFWLFLSRVFSMSGFTFLCVSLPRSFPWVFFFFPLGFYCKTNFCCIPKWRQDQLDSFLWFVQVADEYMFSLEESKKSKGRRQPLSKLPRHHPLVLQDCVSDDGKCCFHSSPEESRSHCIRTSSDRTSGGQAEGQGWACGLALLPDTP